MKREIERFLTTQYIARNIEEYDTLESTQVKAKELVGMVPNGTMILANYQTKGIGTHDRTWCSTENANITFTLILYPNCNIEKLEGITIRIAECIKKTLKELYDIEVKIKKPNDIILNGKKLAGILTQTSTIEEKVQYLLIGIGLNVNQEIFSDELEEIATSLKKEYRKEFHREEIISCLCDNLERILKM